MNAEYFGYNSKVLQLFLTGKSAIPDEMQEKKKTQGQQRAEKKRIFFKKGKPKKQNGLCEKLKKKGVTQKK